MGSFRIRGGAPLFGRVRVSGSKNAALPVIFASIATCGISAIDNLPDISDVRAALAILEHLGARITRSGLTTYIDTRALEYAEPPSELVGVLRASTYLLSSMLVRFGRVKIGEFGGCSFAPRPIDMHLYAISSHGAVINQDEIRAEHLFPSEISFDKRSVGATVNALILAAATPGRSLISGCALEPHILTLIDYLRSAGACITIAGDVATVHGCTLTGGKVHIGGDMIEAGSLLAASVISGGAVGVYGADPVELRSFVAPFIGAGLEYSADSAIMLKGMPRAELNIVTAPYPGFPTDLQPIAAPLLSFSGGSLTDTVWQGRFGYLSELARFGIRSRVVNGRAEIFRSEPHAAEATAPDLRGGMALMLAALAADGESIIHSGELLLRGYERLAEKLIALGAEIEYIE